MSIEPQLLSKPIETESPYSFLERIQALYEPRSRSGKTYEPKPKGRFLSKPTKGPKRPEGVYEVRFTSALGEKTGLIPFKRDLKVPKIIVTQVAKLILCSEESLVNLLEKKKFKIT